MRSQLAEWYEPDESALREILKVGTIALDANVLLDLYRLGDELRNKVTDVLIDASVRSRLFVPYQAALEYQRNRLNIAHTQSQSFAELRQELDKLTNILAQKTNAILRDKDVRGTVNDTVRSKVDELHIFLAELEKKHVIGYRDIRTQDFVRNTIDQMLADDGQVGLAPNPEELKKRLKEADERYKQGIPTPGLADYVKKKPKPEGDYLIWCELLDHARSSERPLLFVTGDTKDDWYTKIHGELIGPRPELRNEMSKATEHHYHQCTLDGFLRLASEHLGLHLDDDVVAGVASATAENDNVTSHNSIGSSTGSVWARWQHLTPEQLSSPDNLEEIFSVLRHGQVIDATLVDKLMADAPDDDRTRTIVNALASGAMIDTDTLISIASRMTPHYREQILTAAILSGNLSNSAHDRLRDAHNGLTDTAYRMATGVDPTILDSARRVTQALDPATLESARRLAGWRLQN